LPKQAVLQTVTFAPGLVAQHPGHVKHLYKLLQV